MSPDPANNPRSFNLREVSVFSDVFFDWTIVLKFLAKRLLSFIVCNNPSNCPNWSLFAFLWFSWTG